MPGNLCKKCLLLSTVVGKQIAEIWGEKGSEEVRQQRDNTLKKFGWEGR